VSTGQLERFKHRPKGQNVYSAYVRRTDVESVLRERDSHMSLAEAGRRLGTTRCVMRAMRELGVTLEPAGLSIMEFRRLEAYVQAGKRFRETHLGRSDVCAVLNIRSKELSAYIAAGDLVVVAPQGFQHEAATTWFGTKQVNRLVCSMSKAQAVVNARCVAAAGRRLGVSDATVRRLIVSGDLVAVRSGRRVLVTDASIERFVVRRNEQNARRIS